MQHLATAEGQTRAWPIESIAKTTQARQRSETMAETKKRIAWVTGGGSGIGLAGAQVLAQDGWTVVVSGRRKDVIDEAAATIAKSGGAVEAMALDVADASAAVDVAQRIVAKYGRIDLLVNSAGLNVPNRSWENMTTEGWDKVVDINLNGLLYCMHAVLPAMRAQHDGCIINVASWAGRIVSRMTGPAYTASKHAVLALTHSFNMDEFKNGIRACCLSPGEVATPILKMRPVPPSAEDMARMLQPEDLGRTIAFVANMPPHVCINEILISPTWNRIFATPAAG
jgi:NADP-dependent 3-hydroxy acid dehydrogenase YdfG